MENAAAACTAVRQARAHSPATGMRSNRAFTPEKPLRSVVVSANFFAKRDQ
jgi:hypothetical protein